MRRRRLTEEIDKPAEINVVPLIDVLFSLLTFFIMSTLFLTRIEGMAVNLPKATTSTQQKSSRATVTLDQQGKLYLNKSPIQFEALSDAVRQEIQPNQDLVVVINADGSVTHDRVVAVMDQLRQIPRTKLAIATKRQ